MKARLVALGAIIIAFVATGIAPRAQQPTVALRDFAMGGGNYYLRVPEFVDASHAAFLRDNDHVIGVSGDAVTKAYPAAAVTWHHGLEDRLGRIPIFVTW